MFKTFKTFYFTSFVRGLAKTSNKKNFYINNSMLYNKHLKHINSTIKSININNNNNNIFRKRIEFHESHSTCRYIIPRILIK
mgnify:CR=1 FL=1